MKFLDVDSGEEIDLTTYDDEAQNILIHLSARDGNTIEYDGKVYQMATDTPYLRKSIMHIYLIEVDNPLKGS